MLPPNVAARQRFARTLVEAVNDTTLLSRCAQYVYISLITRKVFVCDFIRLACADTLLCCFPANFNLFNKIIFAPAQRSNGCHDCNE